MTTDPDFADVYRHLSAPETPAGLSRRTFLAGAVLASTAAVVRPSWASASTPSAPIGSSAAAAAAAAGGPGSGAPILVVIQLGGGNDGLNTVVPITDPAYTGVRPHLALASSSVINAGRGVAFHPSLPGIARRYQAGQVAVVQGVDYPGNNLSHFYSMQQWMTGIPGAPSVSGWMGRWLDEEAATNPFAGVALGTSCPLSMIGTQTRATTLPTSLVNAFGTPSFATNSLRAVGPQVPSLFAAAQSFGARPTGLGPLGDMLGESVASTVGDANMLSPVYGNSRGGGALTTQLSLAASLINANLGIRVIHCATGAFDTHTDELANQAQGLSDLDNGITAFYQNLSPALARRVVLMTFSEFGRRPVPNSSGGTDHGKASSLFVIGNPVKGGVVTPPPSLTKLDNTGNLVMTTDYRSVYATVIDRWLGGDSRAVLQTTMPELPLFA